MHVEVEDVPMEEDEELSDTLLNPVNNMRPTNKDTVMEPVDECIGDIHEPEAQAQDVPMDWSIKKPTYHDPEGLCPHPTGCTIKYEHKLKECPIYAEDKSPFIAMEMEVDIGQNDDEKEMTNKERMRGMRQDEEYREKERVDDAAGKKRKWDAMSPEKREEINKRKRERARERRAEEKAKKAAEEGNITPADRVLTPEEKKEETNRKKRERAQQVRTERKAKKIMNPKGYIVNEEEWLVKKPLPKDDKKKEDDKDDKKQEDDNGNCCFAVDEKQSDVSDGKYRDEDGRHHLGKMDKECGYCGALGFEAEIQGTFTNPENPDGEKLVHFGNLCCCKGRVNGITDYNLPEELERLYTSDDPMAVHFRNNARTYNNGMAMCSVTAQKGWTSRTHNGKMSSMLTAGGQLFRRVGSMLPAVDGEHPKCVQTYFYGGDEATKWRILNTKKKIPANEKNSYETVFNNLHDILTGANNKYIESFLGVKEYVEEHLQDKVWDVKLSIHANQSPSSLIHNGRLNAPTVNEIAILLPSNDVLTKNHKRYVTINYRQQGDTDELQFIPDIHKSYDPLQYPLLFPDGQDGWHCDLEHTCLEHINFQLMKRNGINNPILLGRSLGQQYIVDQFAKSEMSRLSYIEFHQKEMRAEVYSGAKDAMKTDGNLGGIGKKVILPSSFMGGDRYMHQQFLDSIALYQRFAHPHLFITMTCNPNWPEIQEQLKPGQTALDQPDLVSRVFNLKKRQLIRDLGSEMIFGQLLARTHSIEFQKRGFPHAHIIIWLNRGDHQTPKLTPDEIDKIICAEIPDEKLKSGEPNPLHQAVKDFMLHGPCGSDNPNLSCMKDGYCKYGYKKDYQSTTEMSEDAYPLYQRRAPEQGGNSCFKWRNNREVTFTNADVVPYNKYLLYKYNCHINVEYCHSVNAIKYHLKYINKGSDQANVTVETAAREESAEPQPQEDEARNEVKEYQSKRYVSGAESCHRLRGNELAERKPTVNRLQLHLPGQQTVFFDASDNNDQAIERIERSERTKLTAFFELNNKDEFARTLLYREIPEKYAWDATKKKWNRRKREDPDGIPEQVGRLYSIHPTQIQLYALRLLLNHVRGPLSYEDIRKVDGVTHETFQDAAIAHKLVKNDKIWIECMMEANDSQTNIHLLRKLFVTILLKCEVNRHRTFYKKCKDFLNTDYMHQYKTQFDRHPLLKEFKRASSPLMNDEDDDMEDYDIELESYAEEDIEDGEWTLDKFASNSCLCDIERMLGEEDKSLSDFGLPLPNIEKEQYLQNCLADHYIAEEDDFTPEKARAFFEANHPLLNEDQKFVFECIKDLIVTGNKDGKLMFLDAPGGTGKTFTLNVLVSWIRMEGNDVATSASSGIAATLLYLGRTAHNRFKLPFHPHKDSVCNIKRQSDLAKYLSDIVLAIIDEGPMLNKLCFEALDRSMKDLAPAEDKEKKFGGKLVLVSGDFRQLLPVIEKANRAKIVGHTLKHSVGLWDREVIKFRLSKNMRVQKEKDKYPNNEDLHQKLEEYEQWLLKLGEGKLPSEGNIDDSNIIEVPSDMCLDSKEAVVDAVFDDFDRNIGNAEYLKSRVLLAATNEIVNEINDDMVERIPGDLKTFHIDTVGDVDSQIMFPTEFLNSLSLSGMPEHELKLKVDTVVILLRNMDIKAGHCNGTRYLVKHIGEYRLVLHKLDAKEDDKNKVLILPRIPLRYGGQSFPFELTRLQFPIKIAFALTINRAQGQSVTTCGILLPKNVWTHGQIYVAFSRCGNPNNIYVWAEQSQFKDYKLDPGKKYVKNVVYQEVIG